MANKAKHTANKHDRVRGIKTPKDKQVEAKAKGRMPYTPPSVDVEKKGSPLTRAGWIFVIIGVVAVVAVILFEVLK